MHVISILLFDNIPFNNVVVNGNILAEDGTKMSKSKRNFPDPNLIIEKYGADALRIYLLSSQLMRAQDLNFKEEIVKQAYRRFNLLLINVLKFYSMFEIDESISETEDSDNILDKWMISSLQQLITNVTQGLDDYDTAEACRLFFEFVEDLSTWYIKNSRNRFKSENLNVKNSALKTLSKILLTLAKLLAPLTPFISELIYQKLKENGVADLESVHLEFWPASEEKLSDNELENRMDLTRKVVKKALELRDKAKIPVRQVLSKLTVIGVDLEDSFSDLIANALNVKRVLFVNEKNDDFSVELDTDITHELKLEGIARHFIRNLNNYRRKLKLSPSDRINLYFDTKDCDVVNAIEIHEDEIKKMVQADSINHQLNINHEVEILKINNSTVEVSIEIKNK